MQTRPGKFKRLRRNLFVQKEVPQREKRSFDPSLDVTHQKSAGRNVPDISFEKEPLSDIESYISSDGIDETNETNIECFDEQYDELRNSHASSSKCLESSPNIIDCLGSEISEWPTSPNLQPVALSEDEGSAYSIASDETLQQSPNFSFYCISDRSSENYSSPEKNEFISSPSHVISESPFKSPNIKREGRVKVNVEELRNNFKTPDNKPIANRTAYSSDRKRKKYLKGGFAEQLEKFSSKEQSDQAIWRHQRERLTIDTDSILMMKVIGSRKQYSNTFVVCQNFNVNSNAIVTSSFIESLKLESGNIIKIYFPWKTFKLEEIGSNIICANFIEVIDRCSNYVPKISRCVFEWSCLCIKDSVIEPKNCSMLSSRQIKVIAVTSKLQLNPLCSILDIVEGKDFFLLAHVQRVFHYFLDPLKIKTWSFLVQDTSGYFAVLDFKFADSKWLPLIKNSEGKEFCLGPLRLLKKIQPNRSAKLFSIIHTLQNRSDIKCKNYQQFCFILTFVRENVTIIEESDNSQFYVSSDSQTIISILTNFTAGYRYSSIVKVLFVHEDKFFVTDESCILEGKKNYVAALQTAEVIHCSHLEAGCILYLRDFQFSYGIFLLDKYSRVFSLTCKICRESNESIKYDQEKIKKLKYFFPNLQNLTSSNKDQELITLSGTILRPDEETSFSWPICGVCENKMLEEIKNGDFFCNICNGIVRKLIIKMQLEVFVTNKSFSEDVTVKLRLHHRTIENLLPGISDDRFYDVECILNKQIGPFNCFIEQVHPVDDSGSQLYILREV